MNSQRAMGLSDYLGGGGGGIGTAISSLDATTHAIQRFRVRGIRE